MSGDKEPATAGSEKESRIAIVFVHGQGEQRPMDDVQELARTMWDGQPALRHKRTPEVKEATRHARSFTVPDRRLGGADFERVTTEGRYFTKRIDFFEFYWADLMAGNRFDDFFDWLVKLHQRLRPDVPKTLLPIRQFLIRFCESVLILLLLYAVSVALLLPAAPTGPTSDHAEALERLKFPISADHPWILGVMAIGALFLAWFAIVANEALATFRIAGGGLLKVALAVLAKLQGKSPSVSDTIIRLRDGAKFSTRVAQLFIGLAVVIFFLIIFLLIWQGPGVELGDIRVALFALVLLSSGIAVVNRKHLVAAVVIAAAAAAVALAAAAFGGVSGANLFDFAATSTFHTTFAGFDAGQGDRKFTELTGDAQGLMLGLEALQIFAAVWFVSAFFRNVSAQENWIARLIILAVIVAASVILAYQTLHDGWVDPPYVWQVFALGSIFLVLLGAISLLLAAASKSFLIPVMADSARYLSRDPANVGARQDIRARGLQLLENIHAASYDRVIVVAHSLGSIVAYELLMDFWSRQSSAYRIRKPGDITSPGIDNALLNDLLKASAAVRIAGARVRRTKDGKKLLELRQQLRIEIEKYQLAQGRVSDALCKCTLDLEKEPRAQKWRITDFVTVGSPLCHGSLLLADDPKDFNDKKVHRKLATCPPSRDPSDKGDNGCTFAGPDGQERLVHSALFSAVRWTNIHFKNRAFILEGDVIGGPVNPQFGPGIMDVEVNRQDTGALFAHNEYWRSVLGTKELLKAFSDEKIEPEHLVALRLALNLGRLEDFVRDEYKP